MSDAPTWGPRARAGDGLSDAYDTTDTPDSVDELSTAVLQGLLTTEQRMQLATAWAAAETGDRPAPRAGTWKPPTPPKGGPREVRLPRLLVRLRPCRAHLAQGDQQRLGGVPVGTQTP